MQAVATVVVCSETVCLSVSVGHSIELCKNGWTSQDAIWRSDSFGPNEVCFRWGSWSPDPPQEGAFLRGFCPFESIKWSCAVYTFACLFYNSRNWPGLRIKVRPTTSGFGVEGKRFWLQLRIGVRFGLTLTFSPRRAMVMTHTHAKGQSVQKIKWKQMDGGDYISSPANTFGKNYHYEWMNEHLFQAVWPALSWKFTFFIFFCDWQSQQNIKNANFQWLG